MTGRTTCLIAAAGFSWGLLQRSIVVPVAFGDGILGLEDAMMRNVPLPMVLLFIFSASPFLGWCLAKGIKCYGSLLFLQFVYCTAGVLSFGCGLGEVLIGVVTYALAPIVIGAAATTFALGVMVGACRDLACLKGGPPQERDAAIVRNSRRISKLPYVMCEHRLFVPLFGTVLAIGNVIGYLVHFKKYLPEVGVVTDMGLIAAVVAGYCNSWVIQLVVSVLRKRDRR